MMLTHEQALQQLRAWTTNPSLLGHARSDAEELGIAGKR
jgi:hypothetical protein